MELTDKTKKILIYGGGAASIVALYLFVRSKNAAKAASGYAGGISSPSTGSAAGGGASGDATSAAQINAATQLAIAQGNQGIQLANIQAQRDVAQTQVAGAVRVAAIQASASNTKAAFGAVASPTGTQTVADIGKLFNNAFNGLLKALGLAPNQPGTGTSTGALSTEPNMQNPQGYSAPGSSFISPYVYTREGYLAALGLGSGPDFYMGNTGTGDSSWFGIGQGDPRFVGPVSPYDSSLNPNNEAFVGPINPYTYNEPGFVGPTEPGIPTGYQD